MRKTLLHVCLPVQTYLESTTQICKCRIWMLPSQRILSGVERSVTAWKPNFEFGEEFSVFSLKIGPFLLPPIFSQPRCSSLSYTPSSQLSGHFSCFTMQLCGFSAYTASPWGGCFLVSVRTHIHDLPKQRDDEIPETGTWIVICVSFKRHIETY